MQTDQFVKPSAFPDADDEEIDMLPWSRDKKSIGETDPETGFCSPQNLEEGIAGEIVVFTAADRSDKFPAGILIGGFIPGRSRGANDPAGPVTVSDLVPFAGGAACDLSSRIPVCSGTAALRCSSDFMAAGVAVYDLGTVLKGQSDNFSGCIAVSGDPAVNGGSSSEIPSGVKVRNRVCKKSSGEQ